METPGDSGSYPNLMWSISVMFMTPWLNNRFMDISLWVSGIFLWMNSNLYHFLSAGFEEHNDAGLIVEKSILLFDMHIFHMSHILSINLRYMLL